ncbi:TetR family transcriptional regulator [Streptomyces griseorubiginosus]|uniref:Tetracycline repressor protein class D n=1 Tax=Streptomyces griseorubiginosus TaxID=67304 RepID=A0AAI8KVE3_9ACTN|nr:TetR/AcrR family transcriptional regulator C-terminal domain-containing protein [Streptomyces griseorubiginosus]AYC36452.1 Tetracycline repressor protein class D [Streptomyces griseorubiginosus]KUM81683.1 hypothetical protein AQI84_02815 [Streptomyces griseorubiginosus]
MSTTAETPRRSLHQEQIVDAALALLDEGGIENLTMRRLGDRLGITAAALYWHVSSRQDLLVLAADTVWGRTALPGIQDLPWRRTVLEMAENLRSMLLRHPWLLTAMTVQALDGPARDRYEEHLRAVCETSGLTRRDAEQAVHSIVTFAIGAALAATPRPYVSFGLESIIDGLAARRPTGC